MGMTSEVYFVKLDSSDTEARARALMNLLGAAGESLLYKKDEFVPVKITLGDAACVYHVSPELVKLVVSRIKAQGAKPFLFDTSVIYEGERQNAVDHLTLAQNKGFGYSRIGAPFIVADGVFGQDGKEFTIDAEVIRKIKVPSFVGMVDSLVVLSHLTGHIVSGFAAGIKNVAMGMSCRPTKQVQHSSLKPSVIVKKCTACGYCIPICPTQAISFLGEKAFIEQKLCVGCAECLCACKFNAIGINWHEEPYTFCTRMVEVASAILAKFKNKLFLNFAFDITKECDCISTKDELMIARDFGILASRDVLSLDRATADLAYKNKQSDYLSASKKLYDSVFEYAAKKGLGNLDYILKEL